MELEIFFKIQLGFLKWHGNLAPYEQKILEGELIVRNISNQVLSFININFEKCPENSILSELKHFVPKLRPSESWTLPFRISSLQESFIVKISLKSELEVNKTVSGVVDINIPGDAEIVDNSHLIFISYCTRDLEIIQYWIDELRARQHKIWMAAYQIGESDWFPDLIKSAFNQANFFIIFLSKHAVNSVWVIDELKIAFEKYGNKKIKDIVPVVINECRIPERLEDYQPIKAFEIDKQRVLKEILNRLEKPRNKGENSQD